MTVTVTSEPQAIPRTEDAAVPTEPIWRLSVEHYHEMIGAGILASGDPIELLEGWLVIKMPKNPPHRIATYRVHKALDRIVPAGWYVDEQEPVTTLDSEPEPDVLVVRGDDPGAYPDRHPGPQDTALVVEVADATLARDRGLKKRIYASARLPFYWIVNLQERKIEVYTDPTGPARAPDYQTRQDYTEDQAVPLILEGQEIGKLAVKDLLP